MSIVKNAAVLLTAFTCGWIMMGLEILGGRMLSPDFGSGVFVWGSIIGVFLLSLSVGYFLGGILSARWPSHRGLAIVIILAALALLPTAVWYREISGFFVLTDWNERWGSLAAACALFLVPSCLLGMVSPYCIRLLVHDVKSSGAIAGRLYAVSTIGSFLGCLHTAFYLILWAGIHQILLIAAGLLVATAFFLWIVCEAAERASKRQGGNA
ncbi:hypothetical protein JCM19992_05740 [Thermostilla marina]